MVDGDVILADGRLTRIDEDRLLDEIRAAHERLAPLLMAAEKDGERFHAPFERIYRRCQAVEIAPETYPARLPH
jgi:5-methylthioadenosine/S-adenosylhomocysteine deaminase